MLHIVLPDKSKFGTHSLIFLAVSEAFRHQPLFQDNIRTRACTGFSEINDVKQLEGDVRCNDAIAISGEFPIEVLEEMAHTYRGVPIMILTDSQDQQIPDSPDVKRLTISF